LGDPAERIGSGAYRRAIAILCRVQFARLLERNAEIHLSLGQFRPQRDASAIRSDRASAVVQIVIDQVKRKMDRFPELKPPAQPDTWVRKVRADRRPDFRGVVFPCPAAEREPDSGAQRPAS